MVLFIPESFLGSVGIFDDDQRFLLDNNFSGFDYSSGHQTLPMALEVHYVVQSTISLVLRPVLLLAGDLASTVQYYQG